MSLEIIIPAHNEEDIIEQTITQLEEKLSVKCDIIVINDHSTDDTGKIVKSLMQRYTNIRLVDNNTERGFANALRKGFSVATADFVIPVMMNPSSLVNCTLKPSSRLVPPNV